MYCIQTDLENRIGATQLAQLTDDTVDSVTPSASVCTFLIQRASAFIDSFVGQVYDTPYQVVLAGTISSSGVTLTGTSTTLETDLQIGDVLLNKATGERRTVASIASETSITTDTAFTTLASATLYRIPQSLKLICVDLACYYAYQRRADQFKMPEDWKDAEKNARAYLNLIAEQKIQLEDDADVENPSAAIVSPTKLIDFLDADKTESWF